MQMPDLGRIARRGSLPVMAGALLVSGCSDRPVEATTNRYSAYHEAAKDGSFNRGWLPNSLPESARDIVETHNIDTNEMWLKFDFSPNDLAEFLRNCVEESKLPLPSGERTNTMARWWPRDLTDKSGGPLPGVMRGYRCSNMRHAHIDLPASLILDMQRAAAWYWVGPR